MEAIKTSLESSLSQLRTKLDESPGLQKIEVRRSIVKSFISSVCDTVPLVATVDLFTHAGSSPHVYVFHSVLFFVITT